MEPACDSVCQARCDKKADEMIRELKNPLHNITWNCKNNYDVYTTDFDPEHSHFDRISSDIMNTERTLIKIKQLEKKLTSGYDGYDEMWETDVGTLRQLKLELGLDPEEKLGTDPIKLNVREAVEEAAQTHGNRDGSNGFTKAKGLWVDDEPEVYE